MGNLLQTDIPGSSFFNSAKVWWEEIGRTTLSVAGDTITVNSLPAKKYLTIIIAVSATGGTGDALLRLNNDSGNNYSFTSFYNNSGTPAIDASTSTNSFTIDAFTIPSGGSTFAIIEMYNPNGATKRVKGQSVSEQATGANNAAVPYDMHGKYVQNAQVSRVDVVNGGTGDFAIGSEVIVLGHD